MKKIATLEEKLQTNKPKNYQTKKSQKYDVLKIGQIH